MKAIEKESGNIVETIRSNIKVLNLTVLLSITAVLLLVVRFMYSYLGYMGMQSVIAVLFTVSVLAASVFHIAGTVSRVAIRSIEEYHNKLNALQDICRQVHEIEHTDELMENILSSALRLTGAEGGSLLREEQDTLRFDLVKGKCAEILTGLRMPRNEGVAGWVIDKGRPAIVNNTAEDQRHCSTVDDITGFKTKSILCAPIKLKGMPIGAVELVSGQAGAFKAEDGEMMECFLSQAALSMAEASYKEDMKNFELHLSNILIEAIENMGEKEGHLKRVAKYSLMIGHALQMNEEGLRMLHRAAMLHDIGFLRMKVYPGMSEKEYYSHARHGYEILKQITFYKDIATVVLHHHERFDGKGYPEGLSGQDIPLMSRIISIAEVFDVISSRKSLNHALHMDEGNSMPGSMSYTTAIMELQGSAGKKFDPALVKILTENINEGDVEWCAIERCLQKDSRRQRNLRVVA